MTDPHATPEQEEQVRRLLAAARHTDPVPPEVAARLDDALAGLVAERAVAGSRAAAADAPTDELAARRRRRRIGAGLLAAAAAVVVGVALPGNLVQVATQGGSESATDSGSGDTAPEAAGGAAQRSGGAVRAVGPALELDSGTPLRRQLREVPGVLAQRGFSGLAEEDAELRRGRSWCPAGAWGRGDVLPARYDGVRAVLVRRAPEDGRQRVDLYVCGEDEPRRTATLRVR